MNGGMIKAAGHGAIAALAGLLLSTSSVLAADLGGNCCADLEERIAELEATTARKGNRKMSLTITGQVNKVMQYWNDSHNTGAFYGLDNTNSSSRFSFLGEARVSPKTKIGFEIMLETEGVNTSSRASQINEDGSFSGTTYMAAALANNGTANQSNSDSFFGDARRAAVWIEHSELGRLTLGRYESAGVVTTIDLGGISVIAGPSLALLNGNFAMRTTEGGYVSSVWSQYLDPAAATGRTDLLRYDSPAIGGFVFSASVAEGSTDLESGYWGAMLRYAGEFSGFRLAAGVGYEHIADKYINPTLSLSPAGVAGPNNGLIPGSAETLASLATSLTSMLGVSRSRACTSPAVCSCRDSTWHVSYDNAGSNTTAYWGETCGAATSGGSNVNAVPDPVPAQPTPRSVTRRRMPACGKSRVVFPRTGSGWVTPNVYGEYARATDWGAEIGGRNCTTSRQLRPLTASRSCST